MIIISPYSKPLRNGNRNAKNYPHWNDLVELINGVYFRDWRLVKNIVQLGTTNEPRLNGIGLFLETDMEEIVKKINIAQLLISVDNFFPHLAHYYHKKTVVIWGQSDPELFGYKENINILKDRKYLRPNQFDTWEGVPYIEEAFPSAEEVFEQIKHLL